MAKKKSHPLGISPKDVKRMKRRRAAKKMADVEKDVTKDVRRGERIASDAQSVAETGGFTGVAGRGFQKILKGLAKLGGDTTQVEAMTRGQRRGAKKRKKGQQTPPEESVGLEHTAPYKPIIRAIKGSKRGGGKVSRKRGGKIMQGYKAGGKV